jgi:diguanylate cyclase (GGDEF)-like protein/PAS domain S-box-containing protein
MAKKKPKYKELEEKLTQLEEVLKAIYSGNVDIIFGEKYPLIIKEKSLVDELKKLKTAIENSGDWILITDKYGTIEYANRAVENISKYNKKEIIGKNPRIFKSNKHDIEFYKNLWNTILSGNIFNAIIINRKKTGELFELHYSITPLKDESGNITHFVATAKDITEQKTLEKQIEYLKYYDSLTGLYNRNFFIEELQRIIKRSEVESLRFSVVILDIDKFTSINDTFGYEIGDDILKITGERIVNIVCNECIVSRFEADKFGIILTNTENPEDIVTLLEKIRNNLKIPINIKNEDIIITLSMGIAIFPENGNTPDTLIKNAEIALSKSREEHMNSYKFFEEDLNIKTSEFVHMQRHLFHALEKNEFVMHYQPYFDATTQKISGIEALLRWYSPKFGIVTPDMFIPYLEKTGMIIDVGKWIIQTVCRQIKEWIDKGYKTSIVPVFINLSLAQFLQKDLLEFVGKTIADTGIYPSFLGFEITESTFTQDITYTKYILEILRKKGISLSIDDFGTGYSSLSSLKKIPINNIKIDRSFINELINSPEDASIVITTITMAHNLGLKTIAEGVETEDQCKFLRILRCDMLQGYYFCKPIPASEVEKFF